MKKEVERLALLYQQVELSKATEEQKSCIKEQCSVESENIQKVIPIPLFFFFNSNSSFINVKMKYNIFLLPPSLRVKVEELLVKMQDVVMQVSFTTYLLRLNY